eukprot:TRINITY_DN487_c0_g1_i4.p1 TRINITY_DN487_c0_g1~~TRINITY_DN487_c0_g1_i4.p1  ORF type:complete len:620 (-),score=110.47 TRINITY_DN487_c0_g1_i4:184-2043(-)
MASEQTNEGFIEDCELTEEDRKYFDASQQDVSSSQSESAKQDIQQAQDLDEAAQDEVAPNQLQIVRRVLISPNFWKRSGFGLWMLSSVVDILSHAFESNGNLQAIGETGFGYYVGAVLCFVTSPVPICSGTNSPTGWISFLKRFCCCHNQQHLRLCCCSEDHNSPHLPREEDSRWSAFWRRLCPCSSGWCLFDAVWSLICIFLVPFFHPYIVFHLNHDGAKFRAVFLYIKGICLFVGSRVLSLLFSRYLSNNESHSEHGSHDSRSRSSSSTLQNVTPEELGSLAHKMLLQGLALCVPMLFIEMEDVVPFLVESLVKKECWVSKEKVGGWINLQTVLIDPKDAPVCYIHYREYEMGLAKLALVQNFGLANVVFHAVSNGGFLSLPSPLKVFKLNSATGLFENCSVFPGYCRNWDVDKCLSPMYQTVHSLLILAWLTQIGMQGWASIDPIAFRHEYFDYISVGSFVLTILLLTNFFFVTLNYYAFRNKVINERTELQVVIPESKSLDATMSSKQSAATISSSEAKWSDEIQEGITDEEETYELAPTQSQENAPPATSVAPALVSSETPDEFDHDLSEQKESAPLLPREDVVEYYVPFVLQYHVDLHQCKILNTHVHLGMPQ